MEAVHPSFMRHCELSRSGSAICIPCLSSSHTSSLSLSGSPRHTCVLAYLREILLHPCKVIPDCVTSSSEYGSHLAAPQQLAADTLAYTQPAPGLQLPPSRLQLYHIRTTYRTLCPSSAADSALQEAQAETTSSC